jgi:putative heme-binding domain-containing protein
LTDWEPEDTNLSTEPVQDTDPNDPWLFSKMISGQIPRAEMDPEKESTLDLLSARFHEKEESDSLIRKALSREQSSETLRLLAMKWIADEQLKGFRNEIEEEIQNPVSPTMFHAAITAKARLDGLGAMDEDIEKMVSAELDSKSPLARRSAFLLLDERGKVAVDRLRKIYETGNEEMRAGVALTLRDHSEPEAALAFAHEIVANDNSSKVRAFASLADPSLSGHKPEDPLEIGEYLFHQNCAKCHRVNGFGKNGGLDLSAIGVRGREHILQSIREPSAEISPQYETWKVKMADGKEHVGFVIGEQAGIHFYSDAAGNKFTINTTNMVEREHLPVSLMPPMLNEQMGEDFQHLLTWLSQLK